MATATQPITSSPAAGKDSYVSYAKLASGPFYSTSHGSAHGYNGRAIGSKAAHFEQTWNRQYPNPERVRRLGVTAAGYDRLGNARLYERSSHVQDAIADETGLLGHRRVDNYDKVYAQGRYNTYKTVADGDEPTAFERGQPSGIEYYANKPGHPALVTEDMPGCKSRRQLSLAPARWTSRHNAETGIGGASGLAEKDMVVNPKVGLYDSEYISAYANADRLDTSKAMRASARLSDGHGKYHPRTLLPLSQSANESKEREPTARAVDMAILRDRCTVAGRTVSFAQLEQSLRGEKPEGFDMRDHIPQYRRERNTVPNKDLNNLGIRNAGPVAETKAYKFWQKPVFARNTYTEFDSRAQGQLEGSGAVQVPNHGYTKTLRTTSSDVMQQVARVSA